MWLTHVIVQILANYITGPYFFKFICQLNTTIAEEDRTTKIEVQCCLLPIN